METIWEESGFGTFLVEDRESGATLGAVGFSRHDFLPEVSPCIEIGWRLARNAWNQGLAREAAQGALACGVDRLGLLSINCFCQTGNHASQRMAAEIGKKLVDKVKGPSYDRVVMIYR